MRKTTEGSWIQDPSIAYSIDCHTVNRQDNRKAGEQQSRILEYVRCLRLVLEGHARDRKTTLHAEEVVPGAVCGIVQIIHDIDARLGGPLPEQTVVLGSSVIQKRFIGKFIIENTGTLGIGYFHIPSYLSEMGFYLVSLDGSTGIPC